MDAYLEYFKNFVISKYLEYRVLLIKKIVGKDPVVMNITITSDIVDFNKLNNNPRSIFCDNIVKSVSDKQSFVFSPNNTTYVKWVK